MQKVEKRLKIIPYTFDYVKVLTYICNVNNLINKTLWTLSN